MTAVEHHFTGGFQTLGMPHLRFAACGMTILRAHFSFIIPAKAGTHHQKYQRLLRLKVQEMGPRFRGDERGWVRSKQTYSSVKSVDSLATAVFEEK